MGFETIDSTYKFNVEQDRVSKNRSEMVFEVEKSRYG